jgi:hypothetical protein
MAISNLPNLLKRSSQGSHISLTFRTFLPPAAMNYNIPCVSFIGIVDFSGDVRARFTNNLARVVVLKII